MLKTKAKIGIIGGAGFDDLVELAEKEKVRLETPFGSPSDTIITGKLNGISVAFLPRHGQGYRLLPHEIPARANIYALKSLGVEKIIAVNSCGSFKDEIQPGELLVPDQVIDRTQGRAGSFSGEGVIFHISLAEPFCSELSQVLYASAQEAGAAVHSGGIYLAVEGPAFSTRAESLLYKSWGADVIGMTVLPEAKLAREAEVCYASLCLVTDYAAWQEKDPPLAAKGLNYSLQPGLAKVKRIISLSVNRIPEKRSCGCIEALSAAMVTPADRMTLEQKKRLDLLMGNS
jgi:5'-methylthioadenosine phosphorylase